MSTFRKFSLLAIRIGLFAVPFVPLYVSNSFFFPFITGKAFLFRAIVEVLFALWVGLALFFPEYRPKKTPLLYALGIFLFVATLATVFGVNSARSFWSNFERMEGLITHLHLFAYFLVMAHTFRREDWNMFFGFFAVSGLIQNFYALSQKLGYIASPQGGFRVDGTIGNPTYLSAYLIFVLAISLMLLLRNHSGRSRTLHGWGLIAFLAFSFQTMASSYGVGLITFLGSFFQDPNLFSTRVGAALNANPIFWIGALVFLGLFTTALFLRDSTRFSKIFYSGVALFSLLTIYFTATRGVILALFLCVVIGAVWYLVAARPKTKVGVRTRWIVASTLLCVVLAGVGLKVFSDSSFIKKSDILSRISSISLAEGKSRFIIWGMGFEGFKERPLLGWGPENYNLVFAKHYDPRLYTQEPWFDRSHQIMLDWLINGGILGLLAYLGIFAAAGYALAKAYGEAKARGNLWANIEFRETAVIASLLFVYFIQNLFVFDQLGTYFSFFAILAFLHFRSAPKVVERPKVAEGGELWKGLGFAGVVVGVAFAGYSGIWKPMQANASLLDALRIQGTTKDLAEANASFERALSYNTFGNTEIREHMSQFAVNLFGSSSATPELKDRVFKRIVDELKRGKEEAPLDPRIPIFLGSIYANVGLFDEAIEEFSGAIKLTPRKQQVYFELADVYIRQKDYGKAVAILEKSSDFASEFGEGIINLGAVYILNGEQEKADELFTERFGNLDIANPILAQVYTATKKYDRLLRIWERYTVEYPTNVEYRKNVAATYLELKKPLEAIRVLEEAIEAIPSFKGEGEEYIRAIRAEYL